MNVGKRIQYLRKEKGLTQKELADKCGTAEITIRQYEGNKRQPRIEQLKSIALVLGVELSDLVGECEKHADSEIDKYELKPCPFCGKKADIVKNICESNNYIGYFVFHDCFLLGSAIKTGLKDSEKEAIKTWNRRIEE